jgi:prepilin-type processing-associated H-X9-DG protein
VNWSAAPNDVAGTGVIQTQIPIFICPSAPDGSSRLGTHKRAMIDYSPVNQVNRKNPAVTRAPPNDPTFIGILGHNIRRKITAVTDGTSNTILLAEDAGRIQHWKMGKFVSATGTTGAWGHPSTEINISGFNTTTMVSPGACAVNCNNNNEVYAFHPGGANVVFADGSVRFAKSSININLLIALASRAGGEVVQIDF